MVKIVLKHFIVAGILLLVVAGGWLTFPVLQQIFNSDKSIFYVVQDRRDANLGLKITTRITDSNNLLTWWYNDSGLHLYKNSGLLVESDWSVSNTGKKLGKMDVISYVGNNDLNVLEVSKTRVFENGIFSERVLIDSNSSYVNFPSKYSVSWLGKSSESYNLVWNLKRVSFLSTYQDGKFFGCSIDTINNVKVNWCNEHLNFNYAIINKKTKTLDVYFKPIIGSGSFDVSVTDPVTSYFLTADNKTVLQEDAVSYLSVTPATAVTFTGGLNRQEFDIINKGLGSSSDGHFAVVFDSGIVVSDVSFEQWVPDQYGIIDKVYTCDYNLTIVKNVFVGSINTDLATCSQLLVDSNKALSFLGTNFTTKNVWVAPSKSGSLSGTSIKSGVSQLISSGHWLDRSSSVVRATPNALGQTFFLDFPIVLQGKDSSHWRVNYRPSASSNSGKISLAYYRGNSDCILNKSCSYVQNIDPWYLNNTFTYKCQITMKTSRNGSQDNNSMEIPMDVNSSTCSFWTNRTSGDTTNIDIVDENETADYPFDVSLYDLNGSKAVIWFKQTDSFLVSRDMNIWLYWKSGSGTDYTDGNAAYTANRMYHHDQNSGTTLTDSASGSTATLKGTTPGGGLWKSTGKWGRDYNYQNGDNYATYVSGTPSNVTVLGWGQVPSTAGSQDAFGIVASNGLIRRSASVCIGGFGYIVSNNWLCDGLVSANTWKHFAIEYENAANTKSLWVDGNFYGTGTDSAVTIDSNFYIADTSAHTEPWLGEEDEIMQFNKLLSSTDVNLFYLSQRGDFMIYGALQTNLVAAGTPDINVAYPSVTGITFNATSTVTLDFNVSDTDTNAVGELFDINYNTSPVAGGTVIINDGNVAKTSGLYCDTNNLVVKTQCHYTWVVANTTGNYYIVTDLNDGTNNTTDASDNSFAIISGTVFGNVNENYTTDINKIKLQARILVDNNVSPNGQIDANGYYQLKNNGATTSLAFILINQRYLTNFEDSWGNFKKRPLSNALLSQADSNAYNGIYALLLPVDYDANFINSKDVNSLDTNRIAIWTNDQISVDINQEYSTGSDISLYIKDTNVLRLEDINLVIGHNEANSIWLDINQTRDTNLTSNAWFRWNYDLNQAIVNQKGTIVWADINYMSIRIRQRQNINGDFNISVDKMAIATSTRPLLNWGNGTRFCVNSSATYVGCLDVNTSSAAILYPSITAAQTKQVWLYADLNLTGYTQFSPLDFDINYGIGVTPTNAN